ncbi:Killer toxin subunits alpha/beta-like protein [Tolypocladium capitatum]|uniref:chitinase n=1 Tax=Tolypocladium capitatum TaxID=45235 RepID=A0A2K3QLF6_9HYPO|nr:Killer toxin subunits alpha/beta-like protein [Tolypocladium capitatum]
MVSLIGMYKLLAAALGLLNLVRATSAESPVELDPCPASCDLVGLNSTDWGVFHSLQRFSSCSHPLLVVTSLYNSLDGNQPITLRSCAINGLSLPKHGAQRPSQSAIQAGHTQRLGVQIAWKNSQASSSGADIVSHAQVMAEVAGQGAQMLARLGDDPFTAFIYHPETSTSVGLFAPAGLNTSQLVDLFVEHVNQRGFAGHLLAQGNCADHGAGSLTFGIVATSGPDSLAAAQRVVRSWGDSTCISGGYDGRYTTSVILHVAGDDGKSSVPSPSPLEKRASCRTVEVVTGDLCAALAKRCGISTTDLLKYNPKDKFCNTLRIGQKVCCSSGGLPIPRPNGDGSCFTYLVKQKDTCWDIAQGNLVTVAEIEKYNTNTWGWGGCKALQQGILICLSSGKPPLPLPVANAVCGPTVRGTRPPPEGTALSSLNPCKLNACCNVWGQCGTTAEFCLPAPPGPPGAPQKEGSPNCISNCGMDIVNKGTPPKNWMSIGYFEGYGPSRPCQRVDIRTVDLKKYTHIHFAFATLTAGTYTVSMGPTLAQFYWFKRLSGVKKILSFGGWTFSTDPATYGIFRAGVQSANREKMAQNIASFVKSEGLDGIDIDWEYPDAPDLPDIPPGDPTEGENYLQFLTILKRLLPDKSAGIPTNKIAVGVTSYGRSFKMTTPGCTGAMCTFTGKASGATPGRCTGTAGYLSNSEIREIIKTKSNVQQHIDANSNSNILVYDEVQWVAYMDDGVKDSRKQLYKGMNFAGVSDWAISLDEQGLMPSPITIGPGDGFPTPQNAVDPRIHTSCEKYKDIIYEAWAEAGELSKAPIKWSRWNKYQNALNTYLGKKSGQVPLFTDHIWGNFQRHYQAHFGGSGSQRGIYNYYYCDADQMPQKVKDRMRVKSCKWFPKKKQGTTATTWRFPGTVWSEYYTLLCPLWLGVQDGAPIFRNLKTIAYEGDSFEALRTQIDSWGSGMRAGTIYHETAHWNDISWPRCDGNELYGPEQIVSKSQYGGDDGYEFNLRNAHSWTLTTLAMWMMQRWDKIDVPMPRKPIPTTVPDALANPDDAEDSLDEDWFDPAQVNPADFIPLSHYGSIGSERLIGCFEGTYEFEDQCLLLCDRGDAGRNCSQNSDKTWKCSGCRKEPTTCTDGLYKSWDDCFANCLNGLCSVNAGEKGMMRCRC